MRSIEVIDHDPGWLELFASERKRIEALWGPELAAIHDVEATYVAVFSLEAWPPLRAATSMISDSALENTAPMPSHTR